MSKSVHHYGYLKQNQGMNTKSQLVVQCYQLAFLLKLLLKKNRKISCGTKKHKLHHNIWQKKNKIKKSCLKVK